VCPSDVAYRNSGDPRVAALAADAHGVLSVHELRACGLTGPAIRRRVESGRLHPVFRGVYAVGHTRLTPEGRWLAAVKACGPGAVLSHASAAMLLGFLRLDDRRPEVTVPGRRRPSAIRTHRTRGLHLDDAWRHHGIPTTSPPRTILDLAATWDDLPIRRLMSRAQSLCLTNLRQLGRPLDRAHGHPGLGRYARVLGSAPPATRSELEDRVHDLILGAGFQPPLVNVSIRLDGRRVIPDFRWPEHRLSVEADSRTWHGNPHAGLDDAEREALLRRHGDEVVRITWEEATALLTRTVARLRAAGLPSEG
jgi:hypothetical protein